jgi:hypothetical protein
MTEADLLAEAFGRIKPLVHRAVDGLDADELTHRIDGTANSIAWLVWHLTRIQDDHVAEVAGHEQVWTEQGWHERLPMCATSVPTTSTGSWTRTGIRRSRSVCG